MSVSQDALISILPATLQDRQWAADLLAGSDPWKTLGIDTDACLRTCLDPSLDLWIAQKQDLRLGVIILQSQGLAGSPYLKSLAVSPQARGNGVGSALLEFGENYARQKGHHFFLCVSSFNQKAQQFYQKHGYHQVGEFFDFLKEGFSEKLFYKKLP